MGELGRLLILSPRLYSLLACLLVGASERRIYSVLVTATVVTGGLGVRHDHPPQRNHGAGRARGTR
jgi:hypothetical protein